MAPTPPTRPRRRPSGPRDHAPERVLALAGVAGLLLVFAVSIALVLRATGGSGDGAATAERTATATATPTPTATPKPRRTPVPLTSAQRAERSAAAGIVESRGFKVVRLRDYDPRDTLRVLIGKTTSGGELAFFFVGSDYIGNDSTDLSRGLRVKRTSDVTTTLTYTLAEQASGSAPTKASVRFTWDGVRLNPESALPDPSLRAPG